MKFHKLFCLSALALIGLIALVLASSQLGLLRGQPNATLGAVNGRLAPPSPTPNSASSQANLYPDHPQHAYATVEPFRPATGEPMAAAWLRLCALVSATPGVAVVQTQDGYLRAEASTRWLRFVDDVELLRDDASGLIHIRSASRLGRRDFWVNRQRVDSWHTAFDAAAPSR